MGNKNIKLELSYDGTDFHGFQIQPKRRTVQGEIQRALTTITKKEINIIASGRTDAGVHAKRQVCNFHTDLEIPIEKWSTAVNCLLPDDIYILNSVQVPLEFHSRYDMKRKTYRYTIYNNKIKDVFKRNYSWYYPYILDVGLMKEASSIFIGEHDFTAFTSARTDKENKVRTIYQSAIWQEGSEINFQVTGSGFLFNMVRILMGALIEIGRKKMALKDLEELFHSLDRANAGVTAPAKGLTLWDVEY